MRTSTGISTEAVYIFNNMLRKLSKEHQPPTSRPSSKAASQRTAPRNSPSTRPIAWRPADLIDQIPHVERILQAMRIPILHYPGFEADDVIEPSRVAPRRRLRRRHRLQR